MLDIISHTQELEQHLKTLSENTWHEVITPDRAKELLGMNTNNRPQRPTTQQVLIRDLKRNNFIYNGDTIRISSENVLLDGQNRLYACVKSGVPFVGLIVGNLPPEAMKTIDVGSRRSHGQQLYLRGIKNANQVSAILVKMSEMAYGQNNVTFSQHELDDLLEQYPHVIDLASSCKKVIAGCGSIVGAICSIGIAQHKNRLAEQFLTVWRNGIPCYQDCPAHLVREKINQTQGKPNQKIERLVMQRMIMSSWNKLLENKTPKKVQGFDDKKIYGWDTNDLGFVVALENQEND
jgi:hypothetical protein